ncbi:carbohydrate ABC transporter permease [Paenibacillus agaridevorans]|uniref:carbohydrate ABC transporter permease n=1 Tax=Paenibacillus agaridevorans TaxID=171404 RepID=UPI001BE41989|nr:carbohydrate ABC transporter permease [Paenibacillus agaridevorans]
MKKISFFSIINYLFLSCAALTVIIPFMYIISVSVTPANVLHELGSFPLFPRAVSFEAYKMALELPQVPRAFLNSVFVTVVGTVLNLLLTVLVAYPLSKLHLKGRNFFLLFIVFTMLFGGGMIPTYLIVKSFGLINSLWALIVPTVISAFNMLIVKQFFESVPKELEESSVIDGANDSQVLWNIYLPVSLPVFAAVGLFYAVSHWNELFQSILYINHANKWPLQVVLYHLLNTATAMTNLSAAGESFLTPDKQYHPESLRMALVIIVTLPMVILYPFVQKHFVKGMLTGSIKG